jgi:Phage head-tail joining protein
MGIGAYRHIVTLTDLDPAKVLDPSTWHCAIQSAATQVVDGLTAFFIRGRYHPGITLETQIGFEGRTFQVQSVTDLDERHVELSLMCVEVVARGREPVAY